MATFIYGEDTIASRNFLNQQLKILTNTRNVERIEAKDLTLDKLTQLLSPLSLFGERPVLVIEGIFGRRESKEKKDILEELQKNDSDDTYFWEDGNIRKTEINKFTAPKIFEFALKPIVFSLLDSIGKPPKQAIFAFHQALEQDPPEKLFAAMVSRIHLLLLAINDPEKLQLQGFYRTKIISQSKLFDKIKIAKFLNNLLLADFKIKTGRTSIPLETQIDLILMENS